MMWYGAGAGVMLTAFLCKVMYGECKNYEINRVVVRTKKLKVPEYRFVLLTDLHNVEFGGGNRKLLEEIDRLKPDSVFFAGDMVEASVKASFTPTVNFIRELARKYPIYYGIGNHEHRLRERTERYGSMYQDFTEAIALSGVRILENEVLKIPGTGISVYGLDLPIRYYRRVIKRPVPPVYLERVFGKPAKDEYSVLLAHHPDQFPAYAAWKPDMVLSGHIHGGIVRLPGLGGMVSPQGTFFPKYDGGLFYKNKSVMILSRGIGYHTIPLRLNNRAEMIEVTLKRE